MKAVVMLMTALLAAPAWAQDESMKNLPGYVDFGSLSKIFGEPSVEIAVGHSLLGLVASFSDSEDPEAAQMLKRLKGVRIQVFETGKSGTDVSDAKGSDAGISVSALDQVQQISSVLSETGWETVVKVSEPDEQLRIFMKINGDAVEGLTVMSLEASEATFINVIGDLDPADLDKVMENFDIEIDDKK